MATPTEIRLNRAEKRLEITFDDGQHYLLPAEYLRVESPSAEVQGHHPDERRLIPGRRDVGVDGIEQVGNYAVRLHFTDHHDTGIYSWEYLERLGREQKERWALYERRLAEAGLSRDP